MLISKINMKIKKRRTISVKYKLESRAEGESSLTLEAYIRRDIYKKSHDKVHKGHKILHSNLGV